MNCSRTLILIGRDSFLCIVLMLRFAVIQYHAHFELSSAFFTFRRISGGCGAEMPENAAEMRFGTGGCVGWIQARSTRTRGSTHAYATSVMRLMTMKRIAPSRTSAFSMERSELFSAFTPS